MVCNRRIAVVCLRIECCSDIAMKPSGNVIIFCINLTNFPRRFCEEPRNANQLHHIWGFLPNQPIWNDLKFMLLVPHHFAARM